MDRLLSPRHISALPAWIALAACGPAVPMTSGGSGGSSSHGSSGELVGTDASTTLDSATSEASTSSTGRSDLTCVSDVPPACADWSVTADFVIYSPTIWPDSETAVTTACDVVAVEPIDGCHHQVSMTCAREGFEETVPFEFSVPLGHLGEDRLPLQSAYFESLRNVEVSFVMGLSKFSAVPDGQMMIREPGGDLVLLSLRHGGAGDLLEGESLPLDPPWWSMGGDWNSPFSEVRASHVGCSATEPIRVGGMLNVPLAVEFETDAGFGSVLDREVAYGVPGGGSTFSVYAPFAFVRKDLVCGDCAPSEAAVLILREPDG